jgi:hypothetical protein
MSRVAAAASEHGMVAAGIANLFGARVSDGRSMVRRLAYATAWTQVS